MTDVPTDTATSHHGTTDRDVERVESCPACGGVARAALFSNLRDRLDPSSPNRWGLFGCGSCGAAYADPRPTLEAIGRHYTSYYTHVPPGSEAPGGRLRRLRNGYLNARFGYDLAPSDRMGPLVVRLLPGASGTAERVVRNLPSPRGDEARLLDVGCGNGEVLLRMRDLGWTVRGVEPDVRAAQAGREAGLCIHTGVLEPEAFDGPFDAVTLSHVIEHVHDPVDLIARCRDVLRPSGTLWIATPNLSAAGRGRFGAQWIALDPPRHLVIFTRSSLRRLVARAGFTDIREPRPRPQAYGWIFGMSLSLGAGGDGNRRAPMPPGVALRALAADAAGLAWRGWSQEIVMTARRPLS